MQLCVLLVSHELIALDNAMHFVNRFNITVVMLDTLLPSHKHKFDVIFYDAKSFVLSLQGEAWDRGLASPCRFVRWCLWPAIMLLMVMWSCVCVLLCLHRL